MARHLNLFHQEQAFSSGWDGHAPRGILSFSRDLERFDEKQQYFISKNRGTRKNEGKKSVLMKKNAYPDTCHTKVKYTRDKLHWPRPSLTQQVILQVLLEREEEHSFSGRVDTTEFRPIPRRSDNPCWWTWQKTAGGKEKRGMNRDRGLAGSPLFLEKEFVRKREKREVQPIPVWRTIESKKNNLLKLQGNLFNKKTLCSQGLMLTLPLTSIHRDEIQGVGPFGRSCSELARSTLTKSFFFTNTVPTSRGALRAESVLALASFTQSGMAIRKQWGVFFRRKGWKRADSWGHVFLGVPEC